MRIERAGYYTMGTMIVLALFFTGLFPRLARHRELAAEASEAGTSLPVVVTMTTKQGAASAGVSLPGTVEALHEAQLHARTSGYVLRWYADLGATVKAGQLLAEIASPELEQEYLQAQAAAAQSKANATFAQTSLERWKSLEKDSAVSRQELDERSSSAEAAAAAEAASQANVRRLAELRGFTRIVAPFRGTVTSRTIDVGELVQPGGSARGLFTVAQTDSVRVYVSVPEVYAGGITPGSEATVRVVSAPGRTFTGKIARSAMSVDPASRTVLTEVVIANPKGELLTGSSATVELAVNRAIKPIIIPATSLVIGLETPRVVSVEGDSVVFLPVQIGRDFGDSVEVLDGVKEGAHLVVSPGEDLLPGMRVQVRQPTDTVKR
jgi:RND family efflux transporter MFP subunit